MNRTGTEVHVRIRNIAVGGSGVGEVVAQRDGYQDLLGITAFVPFSCPGETVAARIEEVKGRYLTTALLHVIDASPERVSPPCSLFTQCGGCELQHLSFQGELDAKFQMILGALRSAKLPTAAIESLQPVVAADEYGYRRRVSLHINSEGRLGFYRASSRHILPLQQCLISVPAINEVLEASRAFAEEVKGKVSTLVLDADDHGIVATAKTPFQLNTGEKRTILDAAKKYFQNASLQGPEGELGGFGRQILELLLVENPPLKIHVPAGHFSQVNSKINRALIRKTIEAARIRFNDVVFDLYAGAGNFSIPLARAGAQVFGVECDKRLVTFARENAARYHLEKALHMKDASVERFLENPPKVQKLDAIIADPPRSGLGPLASKLPHCKTLCLISCHLPSCVRDIKSLIESGWELESITPFDMFAQTSYVEVLSVLRRNS